MILGLTVEIFLRNDRLYDLLHDVLAELLEGDLLAVLDGHDDGVNADWHACSVVESVFAGDLLSKILMLSSTRISN